MLNQSTQARASKIGCRIFGGGASQHVSEVGWTVPTFV